MTMELTKSQRKAVELVQERQTCVIAGFAGAGKTSLARVALENITSELQGEYLPSGDWDGEKICISAPTHKALKVIKAKMPEWRGKVEYRTVASLLGKVPLIDDEGQIRFSSKSNNSDRSEYLLIIIDEASMIDEKSLGDLQGKITPSIVYLGDPAQLPPVRENASKVFQLQAPSILLTEVHRQKGPLIDFLQTCRQHATGEKSGVFTPTPGPGVIRRCIPDLECYNDLWLNNTDSYRILCWTNEGCRVWNNRAREAHKGLGWGFEVGEPIMCGEPISRNECIEGEWRTVIYASASSEMLVTSVKEGNYEGFSTVELETDLTEPYGVTLHVLNPSEQVAFDKELSKRFKTANGIQTQYNQGDKSLASKRRKAWRDYYAYKGLFDDVRHRYALTVHRSQGSQFIRGHIDAMDLKKSSNNPNLHNRLWYTAATRFVNGFTFG